MGMIAGRPAPIQVSQWNSFNFQLVLLLLLLSLFLFVFWCGYDHKQVNYLVYPGTSGTAFHDAIVVDKVVVSSIYIVYFHL